MQGLHFENQWARGKEVMWNNEGLEQSGYLYDPPTILPTNSNIQWQPGVKTVKGDRKILIQLHKHKLKTL